MECVSGFFGFDENCDQHKGRERDLLERVGLRVKELAKDGMVCINYMGSLSLTESCRRDLERF